MDSDPRIVIAEDDPLLREGLALLLRAESIEVVATAGTPEAALAAIDEHKPSVAIFDVRMPPTHTDEGIRAAVEARRRQPGLAILVLSAYVEQSFATELLSDGVGRVGYLLKERVGRVEEFLDALHRVAAGGTAIDPEIVAQLFTRSHRDARLERLTLASGTYSPSWPKGWETARSRNNSSSRRARSTSTSAASSPSWTCRPPTTWTGG